MLMNQMFRYGGLAALLGALPFAAQAQGCDLEFSENSYSLNVIATDIENNSAIVESLPVNVRSDREGGCSGTIRVSFADGPPEAGMPEFELRGPAKQELSILPSESSGASLRSDILLSNIPDTQSGRNTKFDVIVPTEWGLKAGSYSTQLTLSLYDEVETLTDRATVNLSITVPPAVSLRIVGAVGGKDGGNAKVDLGTLLEGSETRSPPFGLTVLSTSAYGVSFRSEHLGELVSTTTTDTIRYNLFYKGQPVALGGGSIFVENSHTSAAGDMFPLSVVVPRQGIIEAGRYSDRVTVTVSSI